MSEWICELEEGQHGKEEIVRCRDCKFCHKNYCEKMTSPTVSPSDIFWVPVEPDGFCAWGERNDTLTAQSGVTGPAQTYKNGKAAS